MIMIRAIKEKAYIIMGIPINSWNGGNRSSYRVFKFIFSARGQKKLWNLAWRIFAFIVKKITGINLINSNVYKKWAKRNLPNERQVQDYKRREKQFSYRPKISIVLPVYNPPEHFFKDAIQSVINQAYSNWELCIADDLSTNVNVREIIKSYAEKDDRIKYIFRTENGHISASSNSGIEIATGDYIGLLDHDDLLTADALYQNVLALNNDRELDFIYSDEDKINELGVHCDGHFKPDWCPDNFLGRNYICHFTVMKASLMREAGGFRLGYEGSQDYDLFLRATEKAEKIYHIPKILYHWRIHSESTALKMGTKPYATNAAILALEDTLERRNVKGKVKVVEGLDGFYEIKYHVEKQKKVSVIIPTKDKADLTDDCIKSVFNITDYSDFEVILMNNNSSEESFFDLVKKWEEKEPKRFKCITDNGEFNFARLMNKSVAESDGEYILLLNNDTEVIHNDWMLGMVEHAQRKEIGAVGAKLVYKNNKVQHAGVIIGLRGVAGHPFVGREKGDPGYFNYLKSINNFSAVTAACLMVRREVYDEVNGFDEDFAVEFNDVDFCLKLIEKGYYNIFLPHVLVYHYESISRGHPHLTKESYERSVREATVFMNKWQKYIDNDPCYNPNLSLLYDDFRVDMN
jgi:GT2 family glycosyltransferase